MTDPELAKALGYRRLALAILLRAWADTHNRNGAKWAREAGISEAVGLAGDARAFLQSDGAAWLVGLLDLEPDTLDRMLDGLPGPEWEQLALEL